MYALKNPAVIKEINRINFICKPFENINFSCRKQIGTHDKWKYGIVSTAFPVKGNSKLLKLLKEQGYDVSRVKKADIDYQYDGYSMWAIAEKYVDLQYN